MNNTYEEKCRAQRLALGKRWLLHWANELNWCAGCGLLIEGIEHPFRQCSNEEVSDARDRWIKEVDRVTWQGCDCTRAALTDMFAAMLGRPGGEYASCGTFQERFVNGLRYRDLTLSETEVKGVRKTLRAIGKGTREIMRVLSCVSTKNTYSPPVSLRQPSILEYFDHSSPMTFGKRKKTRKKGTMQAARGSPTPSVTSLLTEDMADGTELRAWIWSNPLTETVGPPTLGIDSFLTRRPLTQRSLPIAPCLFPP